MNHKFADVLDTALEEMKDEPITAVLTRYPDQVETLAPLLTAVKKMSVWQTAVQPAPTSNWQTADRAAFLAQIEELPDPTVSHGPLLRLKGWLMQKRAALRKRQAQKEHKPMNVIFARAIATALVILGLGGGTVALANDSLPDTPLYPVKLILEETRMAMADNPVEQASLQMNLAQTRLQEMTQLMQAGDTIGEPVVARLETHLQEALQLAAQTGETEMVGLLQQMQTMLQNEQQTMAQLGDPAQAMFGEVNQMMNQYQEQVQAGLEDPQMFRWRHNQDAEWDPSCSTDDCDPWGNSHQNGQDANANDNGQNGPGGGTCDGDCDPVGDENKFGQDQNDGQNGPGNQNNSGTNGGNGSGQNGPGDGSCDGDCDPVGDQNHYGQDETNAGQNGPGDGDGICDNNCDPVGDQNQYGQDDSDSGQNGPGDSAGGCVNDCEPAGSGPHQEHEGDDNHGQNSGHGGGG